MKESVSGRAREQGHGQNSATDEAPRKLYEANQRQRLPQRQRAGQSHGDEEHGGQRREDDVRTLFVQRQTPDEDHTQHGQHHLWPAQYQAQRRIEQQWIGRAGRAKHFGYRGEVKMIIVAARRVGQVQLRSLAFTQRRQPEKRRERQGEQESKKGGAQSTKCKP